MRKIQFGLSMMLPAMALSVALCFASQPTLAQSAPDPSRDTTSQQQMPSDQGAASEKTFEGKVAKSGSRLVLTAADGKTTYQLDDQQKAQHFLTTSVKAAGGLDASTGTLHVI